MGPRHVIYGPPGTGKTSALIRHVQTFRNSGGSAERVALLSFSRRAVAEARSRLPDGDYPWCRTLHSTAFRLLGLTRGDVVTPELLRGWCDRSGFPFRHPSMDPLWLGESGDVCLALVQLAAARRVDPLVERNRWGLDVSPAQVTRFAAAYSGWKRHEGLYDYADMIATADVPLDVDLLCVDEAQDCTPAQWALLRRIAAHVPRVIFAGDDDQAIYEWAGADPTQLLRWKATQEVLPQSYRLPAAFKRLSDLIAGRIRHRAAKQWAARASGDDGLLRQVNDPGAVDLRTGSWLLLARHQYQLKQWREVARAQGVVYSLDSGHWSWALPAVKTAQTYEKLRKGGTVTRAVARGLGSFTPLPAGLPEVVGWEHLWPGRDRQQTWITGLPSISPSDRAYIRALRRSGESLTAPGRVRISTIHGAKGAEADHVAVLPDISQRAWDGLWKLPDAEHRVWYVALTRALHTLTLIAPSTPYYYGLAR